MLSFVVQNYENQPFFIKTKRYISWLLLNSLNLKRVLLKQNTYFMINPYFFCQNQLKNNLMDLFFLENYWFSFINKLNYTHNTVISNNATKGYYFLLYSNVLDTFFSKNKEIHSTLSINNYVTCGLQSYLVLEFPFHKKVYDTFIFFIIFVLTTNYVSFKNDFTLKYNFILKPNNFNMLFFLNKFYFPTHNY